MALARVEEAEWLDQGQGSDADVAANLAEMWRINRWLGGLGALTRHLYPRLRAAGGPCTVLDLGTGSAQLPLAIARWAQAHHSSVTVTGIDWSDRCLAVARRQARGCERMRLLRADARRLPLAERGADFVISSLFLHHFAPGPAADLLGTAYAVARRALIMTDLVRGHLPQLAFRMVQPAVARHPFTRHDGSLSIRRAYTPAELRALAAAAGLTGARVHTHWPWRMTLIVDRDTHA